MTRIGMLALGIGLLALSTGTADEKAEKFDAAKLVGSWTITSGTKFGEKVDAKGIEGLIVITKDKIQIMEGDKVEHEMSYKLDAGKTPVQIDMTGTKGPAENLSAEGIIELKGEVLKLAYAFPGEKRPVAFKSEKDGKILLFEMKPAKKK